MAHSLGPRQRWAASRSALTVAAIVAVVGLLVGGAPVVVLLWVVIIVAARGPGSVPAAPVAFALLAGSAVATVLEAPLAASSVGLDFARERSLAAATAHLAGLALLVAVVTAAVAERSPSRAVPAPGAHPLTLHRSAATVRAALPWVGVVAAALATWALLSPPALSAAARSVAANLQTGYGFSSGLGEISARTAAATAPLAPVVAALAPTAVWVTALLAAAVSVVAVMWLTARVAGHTWREGWVAPAVAGMLAAAVPAAAGQGLAASLTIALMAAGLTLAWPPALTPARAAAAGTLLAGAALARPEALAVIPLAAAWICLARWSGAAARAHTRWRQGAAATLLIAVAGLCLLPWSIWLSGHTGRWWTLPGLGAGTWLAWALPVAAALCLGAAARRGWLTRRRGSSRVDRTGAAL